MYAISELNGSVISGGGDGCIQFWRWIQSDGTLQIHSSLNASLVTPV